MVYRLVVYMIVTVDVLYNYSISIFKTFIKKVFAELTTFPYMLSQPL